VLSAADTISRVGAAAGTADTGSARPHPIATGYPRVAYRRRLALIRTGKLDMSLIRTVTFPLHALPDTNEQAAAGNFECVVSEHRE
jgi:hypothetical protein